MLSKGFGICLLCLTAEHTYPLPSADDHFTFHTLSVSNMSSPSKHGPALPYSAAVNPPNASTAVSHQRPPAAMLQTVNNSADDITRVSATYRCLQQCGFYYEGLYLQDTIKLLQKKPVGTFLIRDSANSRCLFALSVQTERGPTSIRVHYINSHFRLDAEATLLNQMPQFECVLELIEYYVKLSKTGKARSHVWLDQSGRRDLHINISQPLYNGVRSLQHLCRTAIFQVVEEKSVEQLPLPKAITSFLRDYPYSH